MLKHYPTLIAVTLFISGCSPKPVPPAWPPATEVESIRASLTASESDNAEALEEFEIPPDFISVVLRSLDFPEPNSHGTFGLREAGKLKIVCRDGRVLDVVFFYSGKEPTLFTVNGVECIRGGPYANLGYADHIKYLPEVYTVAGMLRHIHRGDAKTVEKFGHLLDKSAGRVPN
ncbi:MAG: hypothetical protein ACRC8S_01185 [Fimbriiglobus sp.]